MTRTDKPVSSALCSEYICNASAKANAHKLQNDLFTLFALGLALHNFGLRYTVLMNRVNEFKEGRNSCSLLRSCFIDSCHVGVSKRFSHSISVAIYCLSLHAYQAPVVRKVHNAIHRINHYQVDSVVCFVNTYPVDSDLSGG